MQRAGFDQAIGRINMIDNGLIDVFVAQNEHCNLDSFPLRFGFSLQTDQTLTLKVLSVTESKKSRDRFELEAILDNPITGEAHHGVFVIINKNNKTPKLVTAWTYDSETEFYLSEVLKDLRKRGTITTDWLIDKHPAYKSGELRTHTSLVEILSKDLSEIETSRVKAQAESLVDTLKIELNELKDRAQSAEKLAESVIAENAKLKQELNEQIEKERVRASNANSTLVLTENPYILNEVNENVIYKGSSCTELVLANNERWYMKTSIFDKHGSITEKAKSYIGKDVTVTSWDPAGQPGKWSNQFYFRNLYLS